MHPARPPGRHSPYTRQSITRRLQGTAGRPSRGDPIAAHRCGSAHRLDALARSGRGPSRARSAPREHRGVRHADRRHRLGRQPVTTGVQVTAAEVAAEHGRSFLHGLSSLGHAELLRAARDPRVVATAQDDPPKAAEVATWWAGIDDRERHALVTDAPSIIGNLDGVPYPVRDRANRAVLAAGLADHASAARTAMLGQVRDSLVHAAGHPHGTS
ncbi:hypothetical protein P9139_09625 [Curtobacterium flaccumfaciens]|nr:hypothetical protein P9139_09625 [Curtobacterium flaccumfaciens]